MSVLSRINSGTLEDIPVSFSKGSFDCGDIMFALVSIYNGLNPQIAPLKVPICFSHLESGFSARSHLNGELQ
jgi:hypothetical protein